MFYGASEFSRDTDFTILAGAANLGRLRKALAELRAGLIAVPPFVLKYLREGHAVHFRCQHPEALRMRVDVMFKMRGVSSFARLWQRRTTLQIPGGEKCDLLSLPDLVQTKKTQRDKDWPMIRRLIEASFFENRRNSNSAQIRFWLAELRTPQLLVEVARNNTAATKRLTAKRPLLRFALAGEVAKLERAMAAEELTARESDRRYWLPLKKTLEKLCRGR